MQARAVASGFARFVRRSGIVIHACAILPEHVHLVVKRHDHSIEEIARHLKADATTQLKRDGLHPFAGDPYANGTLPSPWARKGWKCFLFDDAYVSNSVRYVRGNPLRERHKVQEWKFVVPFVA